MSVALVDSRYGKLALYHEIVREILTVFIGKVATRVINILTIAVIVDIE